jgi:ribose/xylose/arabinose/galactoside ABC-type transport system permease subunit
MAATGTPTTQAPRADGPGRLRQASDRLGGFSELSIILALVAVVVIFGALKPSVFLTWDNINSILVAASILVILAVGQTYVVVTAGIDLSINATVILSAVVFGAVFGHGHGIALGIVAAVLAGLAVGVINGLVITKGGVTDFIATLGMLSVATGLTLLISNAQPVSVFNKFFTTLATGSIGPIRYMVLIAIVVALIAHVVLFHTRLGTHLLAVGGNREAADDMGIDTARIKIVAYTVSGLLAGIASILVIARVGAAEPQAGTTLLLNSVAAVVLGGVSLFGGRGSILGPVVGALILQTLINGLTVTNVPVYWQPIAVGSVVILSAMAFQRRERRG